MYLDFFITKILLYKIAFTKFGLVKNVVELLFETVLHVKSNEFKLESFDNNVFDDETFDDLFDNEIIDSINNKIN
ncbi:hypothetical protein DDB_G0276753 [Dictyostelium discoideum AX4]|uniref:Uncharacterized protein n=1 Tax=Dictyostelium discoideum TaxID=44689 RepID=Q550Y4_DICDI|nr:hypothetical protein DDB_G0276753 [Dictyostelium discoideum AX4]EAL69080.1 hypothetical protein DDB_G0276753 [Dictyostelium discoideum AX4]|eukprot:XP_643000.1 hypothetical protein DDB_G0276753 [Dictyostelium discoideum AX4]